MSESRQFACGACGRKYAWKAELAGKKVRCKCGQPVAVPAGGASVMAVASSPGKPPAPRAGLPTMPVASPPPRPPAIPVEPAHHDEPDLDGLYALAGDPNGQPDAPAASGLRCPSCQTESEPGSMICLNCGMNFQTGQRLGTAIVHDDGIPAAKPRKARGGTVYTGGTAPTASAAGPRVLGYAGTRPGAAAAAAGAQAEAIRPLMWPMIMVGLGVVMTYVYCLAGLNLSFGTATIYIGVRTAIDLVLLFVACLAAIKLLDISLGAPGEAVLKLIAVALLPAAVEGLISEAFPGGFMVGWAVAYGLYLMLLMWFFELDGSEVMILSVIIWAIRTWAGMALVGILLGAILNGSGAGGGGGGGGGGVQSAVSAGIFGSDLKKDGTPAGRENLRAEVMLTRAGAEEAETFLARGDRYSIKGFNHDDSVKAIEEIAAITEDLSIAVSDVATFPNGDVVAAKLVVELPTDPALRARLFGLHKERLKRTVDIDLVDHGPTQGYMILDFDGDEKY